MNGKHRVPWQQFLLLVMLIAGITVVAVLSCKAVTLQKNAGRLSGAVIAADNASAAFYAADTPEEIAALIGGEADGNTVTLLCGENGMADSAGELLLTMTITSGSDEDTCAVSVLCGEESLYSVSCGKARLTP